MGRKRAKPDPMPEMWCGFKLGQPERIRRVECAKMFAWLYAMQRGWEGPAKEILETGSILQYAVSKSDSSGGEPSEAQRRILDIAKDDFAQALSGLWEMVRGQGPQYTSVSRRLIGTIAVIRAI